MGNLRCFDATKNAENKKPFFNWFDRDNCFISGVRRAPQYTDLFWSLFLKVAVNIGDMGKAIAEATTAAEIDRLRAMKIKVVTLDGSECITEEVPVMSTQIRAMIDDICFMPCYGHRQNYEKISPARRAAFADYSRKVANDYEDEFYESWKRYRTANPPVQQTLGDGGDSESERLVNILMGSDDEGAGAGAAPAAGPAAPADADKQD